MGAYDRIIITICGIGLVVSLVVHLLGEPIGYITLVVPFYIIVIYALWHGRRR